MLIHNLPQLPPRENYAAPDISRPGIPIIIGIIVHAIQLSMVKVSAAKKYPPVKTKSAAIFFSVRFKKRDYRLSRLTPLKSWATCWISLTPKAVWTIFSSSEFAASHI